ncbi:MAG TPA: ribosome maturation factor RimM [Ignavibacteriaceae bacterium]|nr:ribosome maturation factor RimM [Ignavibacteriaceae bacterium]
MDDFYFVARIVSAGKDGFVKIQSESNIADDYFDSSNEVYLDYWGKKKKFIIEEVSKSKNSFFIKFKNFDDERDQLVLIGRNIFVNQKNLSLQTDQFFNNQDLIGCQVFRNDVLIGIVKNLFNAPANDVIEIMNIDGKEILIPFVDAYFEMMDVKNKKLILKPDAGFYDDED